MAWTSLCELDELAEGRGTYVEIDGFRLAVFLVQGQVRVIDDMCPHAGASLAQGFVEGDYVVCPAHFWSFNLESGELHNSPACRINTYPIRLLERAGQPTLIQADLPIY